MNKQQVIRAAIFLMLVAFVVLLRVSGVADFITIEYITEHKEYFKEFIESHYWHAVLGYIGIYIFLVTFSIPVTIVMNIAGGFFFGIIPTILFADIGATIGALICFLAVRYLLGNIFREKYKKAYESFSKQFDRYGIMYILSLHLFPVTPFAVINVLAGLSNISIKTFLMATSVGLIPACIVYAFAGKQLTYIQHAADILSPSVIMALCLLGALSLIPVALRIFGFFGTKKSK